MLQATVPTDSDIAALASPVTILERDQPVIQHNGGDPIRVSGEYSIQIYEMGSPA